MREKFELCVKVVGLVLLSLGILVVVNAILIFFLNPFRDFSSSMLSGSPLAQQFQDQVARELWNARIRTTVFTSLSGIATVMIGVYLMRSNNLIVRLCYPPMDGSMQPGTASGPSQVDMTLSGAPAQEQGRTNPPETRYAPPGYFQ